MTLPRLQGQTIETHLARIKGQSSGFDYLRLFLAIGVLTEHALIVTHGTSELDLLWRSPLQGLSRAILPMFFALSGYLVAGSLCRTTLREFALLRILRIVPALAVEVTLSAILLGGALTLLPWRDYFTAQLFWSYFLNLVGYIHYYLPGVFQTNPYPGVVNGSLWTIPYELECYVALVILALTTLTRHRGLFLIFVLAANLLLAIQFWMHPPALYWQYMPGRMLIISFLYGVAIQFHSDRVILNGWLCAAAAAAMLLLLSNPWASFFAALPAAYVTVWLGMTMPPRKWLFGGADFSYGLYLFAFPISQAYVFLFPGLRQFWATWTFTMILGLLYAAFSWHVVEKPILKRKKAIIGAAGRIFDWRPRRAAAKESG